MLKLTPRKITAAVLFCFLLMLGLQHMAYQGVMAERRKLKAPDLADVLLEKYFLEALRYIERLDYDIHLRWKPFAKPNDNIVVVEVNEPSLSRIGQFPFARRVYKTFLERIQAAGARVIAFDITFPEVGRNDSVSVLTALRHDLMQREGFDSPAVKLIDSKIDQVDDESAFQLALTEAKIPVVMGFAFSNFSYAPEVPVAERLEALLPKEATDRVTVKAMMGGGEIVNGVKLTGDTSHVIPVVPHLKILQSLSNQSRLGVFISASDVDSVIRRTWGAVSYNGKLVSSLSVQAVASYLGVESVVDFDRGIVVRDSKQEGKLTIPLAPTGTFLLNYYGAERTFKFYEFADVMEGKVPADAFKDKIVFVGVTAIGLKDIRATPFSRDYPGVETHATAASNILNHEFLQQDGRYFWYGYLLILLCGVLSSVAVYRWNPLTAFAVAAVITVVVQLGVQFLLFNRGIVVPTIIPSLSCFATLFAGVLYRYFTEEREKKAVRAAFSRYVSGAVVEEILKDQTKLRLGGQKKELTVMFVDLVNFTHISEHMDAAFVTTLLNEYFTRMTNILLHNKGTLDKYMGDGIMCFWGAPLENPEHARLACLTALEMYQELKRINHEWKLKHGIQIEARIGVHTGDMAVGNMGSDQVFSYTVMGDNVNLGSRIEGVNTVYGTSILVSAATAAKAGPGFLFRPLDRVQVKGRDDFVDILELVSLKQDKEPEWVHAFRVGLKHYQAGEWDDAESAFGACLTLKPGDGPAQVFIERIRDFRIVAPDEWSGVWKLSSK